MVNYQCEQCSYMTSYKSNLTRHIKVHQRSVSNNESVNTECSYCNKKFSDKYKCKRHMVTCCPLRPQNQVNAPIISGCCTNLHDDYSNLQNANANLHIVIPNLQNDNQVSSNVAVVSTQNTTLKCSQCYKTFSNIYTLQRHIKASKCKRISKPTECEHCHVILSSRSAKSRHMKTCKCKNKVNTVTVNPPSTIIQTQNNNCNISTTNNYYNNIVINNFGQESLSHVSPEFINKCIMNLNRGICDYIERVNFNPDYPQNHTIRYENTHSVKVKEGDDIWRLRNMVQALSSLIETRARELEKHYYNNERIMNEDEFCHHHVIRDTLKYAATGIKKEIRSIYQAVVTMLLELENMYKPEEDRI